MITDFDFNLYLRTSKKNKRGESAIYLKITDNQGKVYRKAASIYISSAHWDQSIELVKTSFKNHININIEIEKLKLRYNELKRSMAVSKLEFSGPQFSRFLNGEQLDLPMFLDFFDNRISQLKDLNYRKGTIGSYRSTYTRIKECFDFFKWNNDLYLKEFSYKHIIDFESFLIRVHNAEPNTLAKHHKNVKALINHAIKHDFLSSNPYKKHKIKWVEKDRLSLTLNELRKIEKKVFSIERIEAVKNLFLFSCYTGMAYTDLMSLRVSEIQTEKKNKFFLDFSRDKTGNRCIVPLIDEAVNIIKPYINDKKPFERVFDRISNQKLNSYLKEVADLTGITINLTHHIARHTFATTICNEGDIDIYAQKDMMGHSKVTTTMIYSKNRTKRLLSFRDKIQTRVSS